MARPGPATVAKRRRELEKKKKREEKRERRAQRKEEKAQRANDAANMDADPDIAGIVPGPQPPLEL